MLMAINGTVCQFRPPVGSSAVKTCLLAAFLGLLLSNSTLWADVESGPTAGNAVPKLPVYAVAGELNGEAVDYVARREQKPTLYCFIPAEKFSRPTARLIRTLDEKISGDTHIVIVWVTADANQTKEYLGRVNMSLKLSSTTLCVYEENASGPGDWGINTDADITVVAADKGLVRKSFGFVGANETVAEDVLKALQ